MTLKLVGDRSVAPEEFPLVPFSYIISSLPVCIDEQSIVPIDEIF